MTRTTANGARFLFALALLSGSAFAFASEIEIPDLESRIRNTGNAVPEAALPPPVQPARSAIPADQIQEEIAELPAEAEPLPAEEPSIESVDAPPLESADEPSEEVRPPSPISGFASFGAGYPGTMSAAVHVEREEIDGGLVPFGAGFSWKSSDGYGTATAGEGFFDREARFSFEAGSYADRDSGWVSLGIAERADGMQALNSEYFSLTRREFVWDASPFTSRKLFAAGGGFAGISTVFSGNVLLFSGDRPVQSGQPLRAVLDESAYSLLPRASLFWERGAVFAELSGFYSYDSTTRRGELHAGGFDLTAKYTIDRTVLSISASPRADSGSGLLVPFSVSVLHESQAKSDAPDSARLSFRVSGGLASYRSGPAELLAAEPFSSAGFASVAAADWVAGAEFGLETVRGFLVEASAGWKSTAFDRASRILDGTRLPNGLAGSVLASRDRIDAGAGIGWKGSMAELRAGYSGVWLDHTLIGPAHRARLGARIFAPGRDQQWSAEASAVFALDSGELPELSLEGTVRPLRNAALSLGWKDAIPAIAGKNRLRNGLYRVSSGELILSGRVDF